MSYLVLARKYRPKTFDQLIGQGHITDILKKSIEQKRIAHAFLFCGPRGVGKTSTARILAKSFNCEKGPTLSPCGTCSSCTEITAGNSFDVIEIDGASNRGIDEIRTLRENVKFAPAYGRFKIYIVDEVHMLTSEAFNALLKTLEEPPEHVKFIFATTESNKVPATILSRCQRFDFKRISLENAIAHLKDICAQEKLKINDDAIYGIAKAAQGSQRDALSILDQLSAFGEQGIQTKDVFSMLGIVETEYLFSLTDALVNKDCAAALSIFNDVVERGKDIKQLSKDLTEHYRHMMVVKVGGPALSNLVDYPKQIKERLHGQSVKLTLAAILKSIEYLIQAQETARVMEMNRLPLEVAFAKMTYTPQAQLVAPAGVSPVAAAPAPAQLSAAPVSKPVAAAPRVVEPKAAALPQSPQATMPASNVTLELLRKEWNMITHDVSKKKMSLATYLQDGTLMAYEAGRVTIGFLKAARFARESLATKDNIPLMEKVLQERYGIAMTINLKEFDELPTKGKDPTVDEALNMFGGQVVKEWPND